MASGASSTLEELMAELEQLTELEKLVATLPSSPPPTPQSPSPGLSFSVSRLGLDSTSSRTSSSVSSRMPSELLGSSLSLDLTAPGSSSGVSLPLSGSSSQSSESGNEGRGRLLVQYVGGSVTFLLKIAVVAWSVRFLRRVWARHGQLRQEERHKSNVLGVDLPLFSPISSRGLRKLTELESVSFVIIDVRHPEALSRSPLPLENVVNIPEEELSSCLKLAENDWNDRFSSAKRPLKTDVLVFISSRGERAGRAATAAAELGFNRCCVLSGGLQSYANNMETEQESPCSINFIGRDAVAFLLQDQSGLSRQVRLIDVRRQDERSRYGFLKGSLHIPAEDWPKALLMAAGDWERKFGFPKLEENDAVILYSRRCKRAAWIAQLCSDAGLTRCFVYENGVYGWRLDPTVLPYASFRQGDPLPEPLEFQTEAFDSEAGEIQLKEQLSTLND